ncbi:MFS transporter [Brenneria goodwinii]|nr:MFS transporter [Brenneria goodwinii]MCG8158986.1 MFS transporter [Brenneria goodwinii]MCG8163507.1 MFS transporter [Brenneria goodwinii]MCG8168073.1 MFS transporter [Brenneria goodwinii]MCG8172864.1 MFS transporter [Brenneria goodwinii]MCG8177555.1 MFS transporter [Brenneria goodwinii]
MPKTPTTGRHHSPHSAVMLLIAAALIALAAGTLYAWSLYIIPLENEFGWNRSQTSLTFTITLFFFTLGMFTGGALIDKLGHRQIIWLGGVIGALGFYLASFADSLNWLYITYGVMAGFGLGFAYVVPLSTAPKSLPTKSGAVAGFITMCFGLGNLVLGTFVLARVIEGSGWKSALQLTACIFLIVTLASAFFVRPRLPGQDANAPKQTSNEWGYSMKQMLCTSTFWIYTVWIVSCQAGGLMVIGHIVPFAQEVGIVAAAAALAMGIFSAANSLGRPLIGMVFDRCGHRFSMFITPLFMMVGLAILGWGTPLFGFPALVAGAVIVAICFGGIFAINVPLILKFFGARHYAANLGLQGFTVFLGGFFGPQIAGMVKAQTGEYTYSFVIGIVLVLIGLIFGLLVKAPARI